MSDTKYVKIYYDSNKTMLKEEYNTIDDKMEGDYKKYDYRGQIIEDTKYKNGKRNGLSKEYYPSGQMQKINKYVDDKLFGKNIYYYPDGKILDISIIFNNFIYSKKYNESGELINITKFDKNNNIAYCKEYENKQIKESYEYKLDDLYYHDENMHYHIKKINHTKFVE